MRRIYSISIMMLMLMTSAQCQQTAEDWFNQGEVLTNKTWYFEAIKAYDKATELNPQYVDAWISKGDAYHFNGEIDEAIKAYEEVLKLDPGNNWAELKIEILSGDHSEVSDRSEKDQSGPDAVSTEDSNNIQSPQSEPKSMAGALRLSDMNEMQLYENAQYGFELSYPANWIVQEPDANDQGIVVGFLAPGEDVNNPATYLFVQIEKLPSGQKITLEQYGQAVQRNLKAAMPDLKVLTESDISIGGQPGHAIVYELASQDATFRVLKAWTLRGENAYAFTYNAPNDRYNKFAGDISKMIGSLNGA
jgi:tetratricopeptide (TPR) repeat protein